MKTKNKKKFHFIISPNLEMDLDKIIKYHLVLDKT